MPLAAVALLGVRRATPWLIAFGVVLTALAVGNSRLVRRAADYSLPVQTLLIVSNIAGLTLGGFLLLGYFVEQSERARVQLAEEQERSELLLRNVLPTAIAERLKRHEGVFSEHFDEVTVLFADIVGFTRSAPASRRSTRAPADRIFSAFDVLAERHGLEKIKTIGDAYMVVAGAPERRPDHAEAIARIALEMRVRSRGSPSALARACTSASASTPGPVVAGVIGSGSSSMTCGATP